MVEKDGLQCPKAGIVYNVASGLLATDILLCCSLIEDAA